MMNYKNIGITIIGQSNEQGPAGYTSTKRTKFVPVFGHPNNDISGNGAKGPSAWYGTTWTLVGNNLSANKNLRIYWYNAAVGGTGCVDHWVGYLTTWQNNASGFGVNAGSWVLPTVPNGYKYKAIGSGANSATTEPTWGTTIGANTADGSINWRCYAADNSDIPGRIYNVGESGYDPNGYIAAAKAQINAMPNSLDQKFVIIGGNQADLTGIRYKTAELRAKAQINLINDLLATYPSLIVLVGLTSYWNTGFEGSPYFRSYDVVLEPSLQIVLTEFAHHPRVYPAGDWFTGLGKSITFVTGESDAVHMSTTTTMDSSRLVSLPAITSVLEEEGII